MCGVTAHLLCQYRWTHLVGIHQYVGIQSCKETLLRGHRVVNPTLSLTCTDLPEWSAKTFHHKQQNHLSQFLASSWVTAILIPSMLQNVELMKSGVSIPHQHCHTLGHLKM